MNLIKTSSVSLALLAGLAAASTRASDPPPAPVKLSGTWKLNKELSDDPAVKMMELRSAAGAQRGGGGGGMGGHGGGGGGGMGGHGGGGGMGGHGGGGGGMGGHGGGGGQGQGRSGGEGGPGHGRGGAGLFGGEPPLDGATSEDRPQAQGDESAAGTASDSEGRGHRRPGLAASPQFSIDEDGNVMAFRTAANLRLLQTDGEKQKKELGAGKVEVSAKFLKGTLVVETKAESGAHLKETYTPRSDGKLRIDFDLEGSGQMPALKFKLIYDAAPSPQF